jgi:uncharacterized protein
MLLCDTGVLLAAGNVKDHHHAACLALMRAAEGPLLVPSPVLGEIGYLLQSRVGPHAEVTFLKSFGGNGFHVAEVEEGDISRIAELVEQYVSLPLGIVDAAMIGISAGQGYRTSNPVTARPMIIRWISDVPSKMVKIRAKRWDHRNTLQPG